ncbi:MAG: phosphotriesterase-related protein [Deltaproteobacteria bacterium]|nr:phosphotriesterase-related protein [Deltaproteobacteria bacterium]
MAKNKQEFGRQAQTVLGRVRADALGITLPHEHLFIDASVLFVEPPEASQRKIAHEPVSLENLSWVLYHQFNNLDNTRLLDEDLVIKEVMLYKKEGGGTIVDVTNTGLGRDPLAIARISRTTGMHVIMGSGYYVGESQGSEMDRKREEEIAAEITADIQEGVGTTGIRAGIIGEIGCSWPLQEREKKVLRACAIAQKNTGAAITIHPGLHEHSPMEILRLLDKAGADISRVIMGHLCRTGFLPATRRQLAQTGCYIQYDTFGSAPFYPLHFGVFNKPCDRERIEQIMELIADGYLKQVLISQDICLKVKLVQYGGQGYAHIIRNILPQMLARGMTQEQIQTIMVENPKRFLGFI